MIETETIAKVMASPFYRNHYRTALHFVVVTGHPHSLGDRIHPQTGISLGDSWNEAFEKALLSVITLRLTS